MTSNAFTQSTEVNKEESKPLDMFRDTGFHFKCSFSLLVWFVKKHVSAVSMAKQCVSDVFYGYSQLIDVVS